MDIQDNGDTLAITAGGAEVRFGKLSPNDRRTLLKPVREARRKLLKENLKDAGVSGPESCNELDAFDQAFWGDREFFGFAESYDGQAEILALSVKKAGGDQKALDAILDAIDDVRGLVARIAGIRIQAPDAAYIARQRYKIDLREAGITGDAMLAKLEDYDTAHGTEADETERPSEPVS